MEGQNGIEPSYRICKKRVLPLNYWPNFKGKRIELLSNGPKPLILPLKYPLECIENIENMLKLRLELRT